MNRLITLLFSLAVVTSLLGCTADYDVFGESPYKKFNGIAFEEQDGDAFVYEDEHSIKIKLQAPSDTQGIWDSVTVTNIDVSSMASLHLVNGKFKEFPSDSCGLDSLASKVSYASSAIRVGDKIRIPKSLVVYIMVVAENGETSIWQVSFSIPGVEAESSASEEIQSPVSDDKVSSSSSKTSEKVESSSSVVEEVVKNSSTMLTLSFKDQLKYKLSGDTIAIRLKYGSEIRSAVLDSFELAQGAAISPEPLKIREWGDSQVFEVVAEDGSKQSWTLTLAVAEPDEKASSDKELTSIKVDGEIAEASIDINDSAVVLHLPSKKMARSAKVSVTVSETASHNFEEIMNLAEPQRLVVTAEDGSRAIWDVWADFPILEAPRIKSMKIAEFNAVVDSVEENGKWVHWIHYDSLDFLSNLTQLKVSDIALSENAEISGVTEGESYDLGKGVKVSVSNGDEEQEYEIRAGYQYPNGNFETWSSNKPSNWDNGNQTGIVSVTITSSTSLGNGKAVHMQTKKAPVVNTLASGNLFIGVMNPKGVAATSMLSYKDGNELIDFGKPFAARPKYMELDIKYTGKNDSCDVYLLLENRTSTKTCTNGSSAGSNVCRTSSDVNTLVASAWYRSISDNDLTNPDVVSISMPDEKTGLRTLRMKLKYGEPYPTSPIMNVGSEKGTVSTLYDGALLNTKGVDNHLVVGDGTLPVTHIRAVFAASADGNHYSGTEGAVFIVDNFRLIY